MSGRLLALGKQAMPEMNLMETGQPVRTRFPWGPALLSAACVAMAAWTWMRYSVAMHVTPDDFQGTGLRSRYHGRYVVLVGKIVAAIGPHGGRARLMIGAGEAPYSAQRVVDVFVPDGTRYAAGRPARLAGRVEVPYSDDLDGGFIILASPASRLTGASVAGLVVAAFGAFVFGLHLRRWLLERKAHARAEPWSEG